jgi:hypothetical protein
MTLLAEHAPVMPASASAHPGRAIRSSPQDDPDAMPQSASEGWLAGRQVGRRTPRPRPTCPRSGAQMRNDPRDELLLVLSILFVVVLSGVGAYFYARWLCPC